MQYFIAFFRQKTLTYIAFLCYILLGTYEKNSDMVGNAYE